jgi:hypothetical protein
MTCNVGGIERSIRIVVGIVVLGLAAFGEFPAAMTGVLYAVGGIALLTGAVGFCPAWKLFGINTCGPVKKRA